MKLRLVKNGVFPLLRGLDGSLLDEGPRTGFPFPGTIQGEGKLAGIPVLFVRTAGCNLRCTWMNEKGEVDICDTPYSSHNVTAYEEWEPDHIVRILDLNRGNINHVVISGGEPTLQPQALISLMSKIRRSLGMHITVETNGVVYVPELAGVADLLSISPKLKSSEPSKGKNKKIANPVDDHFIHDHAVLRKNTDALQKYINGCMHMGSYYGDQPGTEPVKRPDKDFQLKFVVTGEEDEKEIREDFLDHLGFVKNEDVLVMPLGSTPELTLKHTEIAAKMAIRNGWRFAQRVHLGIFGDVAGT